MERAEAGVILACALEFDAAVYDVNNVDAGQKVINEMLGYSTCHVRSADRSAYADLLEFLLHQT